MPVPGAPAGGGPGHGRGRCVCHVGAFTLPASCPQLPTSKVLLKTSRPWLWRIAGAPPSRPVWRTHLPCAPRRPRRLRWPRTGSAGAAALLATLGRGRFFSSRNSRGCVGFRFSLPRVLLFGFCFWDFVRPSAPLERGIHSEASRLRLSQPRGVWRGVRHAGRPPWGSEDCAAAPVRARRWPAAAVELYAVPLAHEPIKARVTPPPLLPLIVRGARAGRARAGPAEWPRPGQGQPSGILATWGARRGSAGAPSASPRTPQPGGWSHAPWLAPVDEAL